MENRRRRKWPKCGLSTRFLQLPLSVWGIRQRAGLRRINTHCVLVHIRIPEIMAAWECQCFLKQSYERNTFGDVPSLRTYIRTPFSIFLKTTQIKVVNKTLKMAETCGVLGQA